MKKRIRIQGILIVSTAVVFLFFYKFLFSYLKSRKIDEPLDYLGILFVLTGFLLRISARGYKREKSVNGNSLVADGLYAVTRNPMYLGTLLIGTGFVIGLLKWWTIFIFLFIFFLIYIPQIKK